MLAKLNHSVSESFRNTGEKRFIPWGVEDVLAASLGDEIGLDQELYATLAWCLRKEEAAIGEMHCCHPQVMTRETEAATSAMLVVRSSFELGKRLTYRESGLAEGQECKNMLLFHNWQTVFVYRKS